MHCRRRLTVQHLVKSMSCTQCSYFKNKPNREHSSREQECVVCAWCVPELNRSVDNLGIIVDYSCALTGAVMQPVCVESDQLQRLMERDSQGEALCRSVEGFFFLCVCLTVSNPHHQALPNGNEASQLYFVIPSNYTTGGKKFPCQKN